MKRPVSRGAIIGAIVLRDLRSFSRDRLWMILTPMALGVFIVIFWLLPTQVEETMTVGVYPAALARALSALEGADQPGAPGTDEGLEVVTFDDQESLIAAVSGEEVSGSERPAGAKQLSVGIVFPENFAGTIITGEQTTVSVYVAAGVPDGVERAMSSAIREIAYALQAAAAGGNPEQALPVTVPEEETIVLGEDRAGNQVPMREKMRPLLAVLILMIESLALAGLVAVEIDRRTVTAVLVTPATTGDVLAAKGITGMLLALVQALIYLLATRSFGEHWAVVSVLMFLGAVMMAAVGMLAGSAGKDFMSTLFYGLAFIIPLMIPAFAVLFPGTESLWIRILPSYGVIQGMVESIGYGRSWGDLLPHFGAAAAWDAVLLGGALLILKRRVEAL